MYEVTFRSGSGGGGELRTPSDATEPPRDRDRLGDRLCGERRGLRL